MNSNVLDQSVHDNWALYNADCVLFAQGMPDNCIDLTVYSPPFSSLYIYSESVADMGNVAGDAEFIEQYRHWVREKLRITRPGRLSAIHVKDLVYYQNSSPRGTAGLRPFSDLCTEVHMQEGWDFHSRITIWRDPVLERSKTNAHGLLWKTFQADASFCRTGLPEYLLVFRKWADDDNLNQVRPVPHPKAEVPLARWQDLASPVWDAPQPSAGDLALTTNQRYIWNYQPGQSGRGDLDLKATDVLNVKTARDDKAEKHLCPMPLNITRRAIELWTNEGDTVMTPFGGIGSELITAVKMRRKAIGTELNPTYYQQACKFIADADRGGQQMDLLLGSTVAA